MTCLRCEGFMVQEDFFELRESDRRLAVWRCVLCGDVVDPIIVVNRKRQLVGVGSVPDGVDQDITRRPLSTAA